MRGHLDAARAAQAHAEGERDAAAANSTIAADEIATLRQRLDDQATEHHYQLEQRDMEYSRAITAAHTMADRAACEHRDQVSEILRTYRGQISPMHTDRQVEQHDADLHDANLTEANLTSANLTAANLTGAHLTAAKLIRTDLRGADLTGANLPQIDTITALMWSTETRWGRRDVDEIRARSVELRAGVFILNPTGQQVDTLVDH
ncbi:pentapeptide repeat-containing protein [Nocardia sp. NPDC052112]|uniref:pentapeptide repeat-containing protein n=1 Tax=Nocardia sp. NPDC052112 TaxID=3155646 RepID=UPI00343008BD